MSIPARRKALFALVLTTLLLFILEGGARVLYRPDPMTLDSTHPSVADYLAMIKAKATQPRHFIPSHPQTIRVQKGTPGSKPDPGEGGYSKQLTREDAPQGPRHFVVIGGSAPFGFGVQFDRTFFGRVQGRLRAELGDDSPTAVVLARPAWELRSQVKLLERYLSYVQVPPAAVVLYAGNNEAIGYWKPPRIGVRPFERLALYRLLKKRFKAPRLSPRDSKPYSPEVILGSIWKPESPMTGASFWDAELKIYLDSYRAALNEAISLLRKRGIPLIMVTLPLNLDNFEGRVVQQAVTYKDVGLEEYQRLEGLLRKAMSGEKWPDRRLLEELVRTAPGGPLQLWTLGQLSDREGRYAEALELLTRAKDNWWGMGFGMVRMGKIIRELGRLPGVHVVDAQAWFDGKSSPRDQVNTLFLDMCHLSENGHARLARDLYPTLRPLLK